MVPTVQRELLLTPWILPFCSSAKKFIENTLSGAFGNYGKLLANYTLCCSADGNQLHSGLQITHALDERIIDTVVHALTQSFCDMNTDEIFAIADLLINRVI